jgi:Cys-tRNA(Pro)/Cys-tRNA(Cys) deacylase
MDLKKYLEENKIWYEFVQREETIHAKDAAKSAGIELRLLSKSLVLLDQDKTPYIAIIPGNMKLSFNKIKSVLSVKKIRLCPFDETINYSGYLPGETPPVYHKANMKSVLDKHFLESEYMYGGGGERVLSVKLKVEDVIRLNSAVVEDIVE